jgi:hypothetical protein
MCCTEAMASDKKCVGGGNNAEAPPLYFGGAEPCCVLALFGFILSLMFLFCCWPLH